MCEEDKYIYPDLNITEFVYVLKYCVASHKIYHFCFYYLCLILD